MVFNGLGSLHKIEGCAIERCIWYQAILADKMLTDAYDLIGYNFLFQHDNASIHTARSTLQWMVDKDIAVLDWPPWSPDVSRIENLWRDLKVAVAIRAVGGSGDGVDRDFRQPDVHAS